MTRELKFEDGTVLLLGSREGHQLATLLPGVGVHHFRLAQQVQTVKQGDGINQVQLSGELRIQPGNMWLGSFAPVTVYLGPIRRDADLSLPLTSDQILALERNRDGGELLLKVDFHGALPQTTKFPLVEEQVEFRVPASEWEKQIESVNRGAFFTVTVPLLLDDGPLAEAARHVREAKRQITAGQYPDAIRETRLAIETMRDMKVWPRDVEKKRDDQDQADRYGLMLDALDAQAEGYQQLLQRSFNQASGIQHAGGAIARASWVRADAVSLTGMAASLMHRLSEEIRS
ncbi:hypothetical protein PV342_39720 [Streptomyces sp. PA03-3a]|nr:hypothetical protein [Streptomyces sp. PA03-3a]